MSQASAHSQHRTSYKETHIRCYRSSCRRASPDICLIISMRACVHVLAEQQTYSLRMALTTACEKGATVVEEAIAE